MKIIARHETQGFCCFVVVVVVVCVCVWYVFEGWGRGHSVKPFVLLLCVE